MLASRGLFRLRVARCFTIFVLLLVIAVAPQQVNSNVISTLSQATSSSTEPASKTTTEGTGTIHTTYQVNITAQTTATTGTQAQLANWTTWHRYLSQKSASGTGCFEVKYPNSVWQRTTCAAPVVGHESPAPTSSTVGNGDSNDYSAESPSAHIASAVGSFPSTTGLTSETDVCVAPFLNTCTHSPQTNYYSLQVNAEEGFPVIFNGWTGTGWQQFIYDNTPSGGYVWIEYWLFGYYTAHGNTCPPASQNPPGNPSSDNWFPDGTSSSPGPDCVYNTASQSTPYEPPTSLSSLSLGAFANLDGSGYDEVKLFVNGADGYEWSEPDTILNLYLQWQLAEFNVFGYIDGSQAQFNSGTSITVANSLTDHYGNTIAPSCDKVSETGETNNLNLGSSGSCLPINSGQIAFTESNLANWVTVSVYSDDLQFRGQNPLGLTDLHGDISNNYQNQAGLTTYLFSIPTNTQVTLSIAQAPNGWYFTDDWDDYGFTQYLGPSSLTINVGTTNHYVAAFFTYIAIFQQSGIQSGTTWGVAVGGYRYTGSGSGIELIGLDGTVSYSYDSIVTGISGVQYVCISGCSGVVSGPTTVTANFQQQYYLTVNSAYGSPSPTSGWLNAGTSVTASVTSPFSGGAGTQYVCTGWSGSGSVPGSGSACSVTFTMNSPSSITWNWETQYYLTVSSAYGSPTPSSGWFNAATGIAASVNSPVSGGTGTQYACTGWSGSGSVPSSGSTCSVAFSINVPSTITWNWQTQYYLTMLANPSAGGTLSPNSGWKDSGATVPISETANNGWQLLDWAGSGSGSCSSPNPCSSVTMNGPITETADFEQVVTQTTTMTSTSSTSTLTSSTSTSGTTTTTTLTSTSTTIKGQVCSETTTTSATSVTVLVATTTSVTTSNTATTTTSTSTSATTTFFTSTSTSTTVTTTTLTTCTRTLTSTSTSITTTTSSLWTPLSLGSISSVVSAGVGSAWFVLPDYTAGQGSMTHTSLAKCGGVKVALATDVYAGTYLFGALTNPQQNEILDTNSAYISQSSSSCGQPSTNPSQPLVTIAGLAVNEVVHYYESSGASPLYYNFANGCITRRDTNVGVSCNFPSTPTSDVFVMEAFTDAAGRSVFIIYGLNWPGTLAGYEYLVNTVLKNPSSYTASWYVYKWTDATSGVSANSIPDPGDTYTSIASG